MIFNGSIWSHIFLCIFLACRKSISKFYFYPRQDPQINSFIDLKFSLHLTRSRGDFKSFLIYVWTTWSVIQRQINCWTFIWLKIIFASPTGNGAFLSRGDEKTRECLINSGKVVANESRSSSVMIVPRGSTRWYLSGPEEFLIVVLSRRSLRCLMFIILDSQPVSALTSVYLFRIFEEKREFNLITVQTLNKRSSFSLSLIDNPTLFDWENRKIPRLSIAICESQILQHRNGSFSGKGRPLRLIGAISSNHRVKFLQL